MYLVCRVKDLYVGKVQAKNYGDLCRISVKKLAPDYCITCLETEVEREFQFVLESL